MSPDWRYYLVPKVPYDVMRLAWQDRVLRMLLSYSLILRGVGCQAPEGENWRIFLYIAPKNVI
ncbi:hypothetical protein LR013_00010 [candidate division NPL-UPA2 bacterium]|nr:hypothetical protein [candidate division NPL-UPA2 bacterium]